MSMTVIGRETYPDERLLLHNIYCASHDSLHTAVHGKLLHFCASKERVLHLVCHDISGSMKKKSEEVCTE